MYNKIIQSTPNICIVCVCRTHGTPVNLYNISSKSASGLLRLVSSGATTRDDAFPELFFMQSCRTGIHQVLKLISDFAHALTPHSLSNIIIINKRHIRVKRHPVFCLLNAFAFSDMSVICPMLLSSLHPVSLSLSLLCDGELCCCGRVDTKPLREWKE